MALSCLIVDDNARYGEAARALLEREGLAVVGVATSGEQCEWLVRRFRPDVVLIDIHLREESGFALARRLVVPGRPTPRVILISTHDEREFLDLIEASPAIGFVGKASVSSAAIYEVLARDADAGEINVRRET